MKQVFKSKTNIGSFVGRKAKLSLFGLMLLLNVVARIPSIPHEKGYDSFFIHALSNSVSIFGSANWWVNWLSVFGLYPYSYASGVPFILSGLSQLSGIEMEHTILLYCIFCGLLSVFTSYLLANELFRFFYQKLLFALLFSLSPGLMTFTTWEVSSRGLFMVLFPLFIYLLLKEQALFKKGFLIIFSFLFMFSVHHFAYLLILVTSVYVFLKLFDFYMPSLLKGRVVNLAIPIFFVMLLVFPFFERSLISSGSRYTWLIEAFITNARYTGIIILFSIGGLVTVLLNKEKDFISIFMLSLIVIFSPSLYSLTYGPFFLLLFIIYFGSISLSNILSISWTKKNRLALFSILLIIICSVTFSTFYNHYRTGGSEAYWAMPEETYVTGLWGKTYVPDGSYGLDTAFETTRVFAVSQGHPITPSIGANNLAYGFINSSDIKLVKNSVMSSEYYFDGPYSAESGTTFSGKSEWLRQGATNINDLYGYEYFVEDKFYYKPVASVVSASSDKIYDSTRFSLWAL